MGANNRKHVYSQIGLGDFDWRGKQERRFDRGIWPKEQYEQGKFP